MPLQIRRGTNAERLNMTQPLASGELLYVTDDQRLYIGNASSLGGVQITGYTDEDAQDAAAELFTNGTHTGIVFTYNDALNRIDAVIDWTEFTGSLVADSLKGSVFADDSAIMVDSIDHKIYATGGFTGDVLGNVTGNVTGNLVGNVTGNLVGNVTGDLLGNITGTLNGNVVGDVQGSVFADDSTKLIDGVSGDISNGTLTLSGNVLSASLFLDIVHIDPTLTTTIRRYAPVPGNHTESYAISDGTTGTGENNFVSRGTIDTPAILQLGDVVYGTNVVGHNGSTYQIATAINHFIDPYGTINGTTVPGTIALSTFTDGNTANFKGIVIDSRGYVGINKGTAQAQATLDINGFAKLAVLTAEPASPAAGMIAIADGATWDPSGSNPTKQQTVVYLGSAWVQIAIEA
jgi:outer membrane lipoprotein SlyB